MKEFTLFNGAAKIIGAGLSTFEIHVEVPDTLAVGAGIIVGVTVLGLLYFRLLKRKRPEPEKKECEGLACVNPATDISPVECSPYDVVGIVKIWRGFIGVSKKSFFFFWVEFYNHDLPTIDLSGYTYSEIGAILKSLGKSSPQFDEYCQIKKISPRPNKNGVVLLEAFLQNNVKLYPFFSNRFCLQCKKKRARMLRENFSQPLPAHSNVVNFLIKMAPLLKK